MDPDRLALTAPVTGHPQSRGLSVDALPILRAALRPAALQVRRPDEQSAVRPLRRPDLRGDELQCSQPEFDVPDRHSADDGDASGPDYRPPLSLAPVRDQSRAEAQLPYRSMVQAQWNKAAWEAKRGLRPNVKDTANDSSLFSGH